MEEDNELTSEEKIEDSPVEEFENTSDLHNVIHVQSMFENWFLDYASYVILDRAVPELYDGLKPVQRRILHAMSELEDGRYNKAANIIGHTMKYHPHGDRSIGDAMVQLGQKMMTIDTQGNWGNILTGDSAAAPRYIEARLSEFALEVVFNPKTTNWQSSYDGRNKEPIALPIKFPLLLAQGVEGIAVALNTKILPHNFNELIDASINILQDKPFEVFPDFPTGGYIDVSKYNEGQRDGKVRNRAKIIIKDNKTLAITEIPFGTTTSKLITKSIAPAIDKGKLKIRKIDDNTTKNVEILLHLFPGVSPDQTIDALYAFTDCEMSYSTNACVLHERKPRFMSVNEILRINTQNTLALLKRELEIELEELSLQWHRISLEKIFFEERIYKELEKDVDTWDLQISNIERAFDPFRKLFKNEISREDVLKLCEKPVRKISKFDIKEAEEKIASIEMNMEEVQNHLDHLVDYAVNYFKQLKKKYGKDKERKTEIKSFDNIVAAAVAVANQKLYVNKKEGFVGVALKKEENVELVGACSDIDEVIVFRDNGSFMISKVSDKRFFGKNIIRAEVFKRNDDRNIYNMIYADGSNGVVMVKRFPIGGVTRDKEYNLTKGNEGTKVLYLTSNPNGEAEKVRVFLKPKPKLRKLNFDFDFSSIAIKGRSAKGNILSRHPVRKIEMVALGVSTLSAINVYFDSSVMRLNNDERGTFLGSFKEADKVLSVYNSGCYRTTGYDITTHFEDDLLIIKKWRESQIITAVYYYDSAYFIKRFSVENSEKKIDFIPDDKECRLIVASVDYLPQIEIVYSKKNSKELESTVISCEDFVALMTPRAKGKKLNFGLIKTIKLLEPLPYEEEIENEEEVEEEVEDNNEIEPNSSIDEVIAKEIFDTIDIKTQEHNGKDPVDNKDNEQLTIW